MIIGWQKADLEGSVLVKEWPGSWTDYLLHHSCKSPSSVCPTGETKDGDLITRGVWSTLVLLLLRDEKEMKTNSFASKTRSPLQHRLDTDIMTDRRCGQTLNMLCEIPRNHLIKNLTDLNGDGRHESRFCICSDTRLVIDTLLRLFVFLEAGEELNDVRVL